MYYRAVVPIHGMTLDNVIYNYGKYKPGAETVDMLKVLYPNKWFRFQCATPHSPNVWYDYTPEVTVNA